MSASFVNKFELYLAKLHTDKFNFHANTVTKDLRHRNRKVLHFDHGSPKQFQRGHHRIPLTYANSQILVLPKAGQRLMLKVKANS